MEIKGIIEDIVFRNVENGYSVIMVDSSGVLITAVGIFPPVVEGEMVVMQGNMTTNSRFGDQFSANSITIVQPNTKDSIYKYLSSGLFKGIGASTASQIVETYGDKSLEVIEFEPAKLANIKGISLKKALACSDAIKNLKQMQSTILYLQNYDIGLNFAIKIYKAYEGATRSIIEKNPYQMVDDIDGVGFITADRIADKLGFDKKSRFRITAGITYCLIEIAGKNGHTYMPKTQLCREMGKLMGHEDDEFYERIAQVIDDNVVMGKVVILENNGQEAVMLTKSFLTEKSIAVKIVDMLKETTNIMLDIGQDIIMYQKINNIELHESQVQAIENCVAYGVNIITGGPGTGKTTIIKCIIDLLASKGLKVCLCAPTGRASKRLSQATGENAKTIHRLLDLSFKEDGKGYFTYNESTKLQEDVIIVDEVSMCDEYVFSSLIKAIKKGGRLIMVGDKDQLPSVGAGNILNDLIVSQCVPINYLTHIYRQSEDSSIVTNAHLINSGKMPILDNKSLDFFFDNQQSQNNILSSISTMVTTRLPKFTGLKSKDIQVLCPMKKGVAGVENVNIVLQDVLNPQSSSKKQLKVGVNVFREGDKVIQLVNNYQKEWVNMHEKTAGVGVFNGEIGEISEINTVDTCVTILFEDGKSAKYGTDTLDEFSLAYAISVHKAQGSEFDIVVLAITGGNYMIMTKNLLYTAVTRAKKTVVIVGDVESLEKMIANNFTVKRWTMLAEFIKEESKNALV